MVVVIALLSAIVFPSSDGHAEEPITNATSKSAPTLPSTTDDMSRTQSEALASGTGSPSEAPLAVPSFWCYAQAVGWPFHVVFLLWKKMRGAHTARVPAAV